MGINEAHGRPGKCFEMASQKGFQYAGLQAGGECWAGNEFGKYGKKSDKECRSPCKHNKEVMCGAGWRNSVYKVSGGDKKEEPSKGGPVEEYQGCFMDKGNRDLPKNIRESNPKKCFQKAREQGFQYAGLQNGGECWAGNAFGKHGRRDEKECSRTCRKDKSMKCGNGWRNSVWKVSGKSKRLLTSVQDMVQ